MKKLMMIVALAFVSFATFAQYDYSDRDLERYHYDEDFDWRWDIRVRISDGIKQGRITRREANRLYDRLEKIESCEYRYQNDGYYSGREQSEVWEDVMDLHRRLGIELNDFDRTYYGYSRPGYAFRGYLRWYDYNNYDFYRFDRRGFGSITLGYRPRYYNPRPDRVYSYHYYKYNNKNSDRNYNNNNRDWDRNRNNRDFDNNKNDRKSRFENEKSNPRTRRGDIGYSNRDITDSEKRSDRSGRNETPATEDRRRGFDSPKEEIITPRRSPEEIFRPKRGSDDKPSFKKEEGRRRAPEMDRLNDKGPRSRNDN